MCYVKGFDSYRTTREGAQISLSSALQLLGATTTRARGAPRVTLRLLFKTRPLYSGTTAKSVSYRDYPVLPLPGIAPEG